MGSLTTSLLTTAAAMHQAGIKHRDIRAANVVQYCGNWVLIDWELAGAVNALTWWRPGGDLRRYPQASSCMAGGPLLLTCGRLVDLSMANFNLIRLAKLSLRV